MEHHHINKKLRMANGLPRSVDDDNSSSGCSSSGALRHVIITPPRDSSSISSRNFIFDDPQQSLQSHHQQPQSRMLSSRNSFSPYNIRPLVIRSKRKITDGTSVNVTSTAQKIINTLNSFSTPVVNAVKVPFDSIKNFRPISTPIRRDSQGPPIMKSPLVPAPEGKIYYNPAMNIHIPKFVEFGTNTDLTMSTFTQEHLEDLNSSSKGGGKMKSFTTRVHSTPLKNNALPSLPIQSSDLSSKTGILDTCKFKFSTPWNQSKVEEFLSSRRSISDNVKEKAKEQVMDQPSKKVWTCTKCQLTHEETVKTCPCLTKIDSSTNSNASKPSGIFRSPFQKATTTQWDCPTCMVPNKPEDLKCVCCGEKNPKPLPAQTVAVAKKWDCPTCMVPNKPEDLKCVCCGEKNPNAPVIKDDQAASTLPSSTFSFGIKSTTPSGSTEVSKNSTLSTFSFGVSPSTTASSTESSSTSKSTFTFGIKSDTTTSSTTCITSTPSITFGTTKTVTSSTTSENPFVFGSGRINSSVSDSPKPPSVNQSPKSISFGTPTESSSAKLTSATFGTPVKSTESALSPQGIIPSTTTTEKSILSQTQSSSIFGSSAFGSTSSISTLPGVIKEDNEFWKCDNCPARTRITSNRCIGCDKRRPVEDSSKSNAISLSASKKAFHFEPFFGGPMTKDTGVFNQTSSSEGELKRKLPSSTTTVASSSTSFMYTPPSEPSLKLKAIEPVAPQPSQASEIKSGSFLDALAKGSQFTFSSPSSIIPSGGIESNPSGTTVVTPPTSVIPSISSSTAGPPSGLFQFGAPAQNPPCILNNSTMNMAVNNNNGLKQTTFTFGGGGLKNGPSPSPTPSIFGSSLSAGGAAISSTPVFGASGPLPGAAAPTPQFNLTPNINFLSPNAPTSSPSPGGFVFTAQPSGAPTQDGGLAQRKIRRATRRIR